MSKSISHFGEFHDDVVYTHKRIAAILTRSEDWVLENIIRPETPLDSEASGVRHKKIGVL